MQFTGPWKVTIIESGTFMLDGGTMMGNVPKVLWEKELPADNLNRIEMAMRCLLVDDGTNRILIETGMGSKVSEKFRAMYDLRQGAHPLKEALAAGGYAPGDITHVINTHLHFDHCGGNTELDASGKAVPAFPNARYCISRKNWEAALSPNPRDRASYLRDDFVPLEEQGVLDLLAENAQIVKDVSVMTVNGHTPGQQIVKIINGPDTILFCGDLIPLKCHTRLAWIMSYDQSALLTLQEKTAVLEQAARGGWWLVFTHDPETAMARIAPGKKGYDVIDEVKRIR